MAKYVYPAVFEADEGSIAVNFPDLTNCFTQGENEIDALEMAQDVLNGKLVYLEDKHEVIPKPTSIKELSVKSNQYVTLVAADTFMYRKANSNKAVKKTLTIPSWLNEAAESQSINFSQVLQDALKQLVSVKQ